MYSASQALALAPVPTVMRVQAISQLSAQGPGSPWLQISLHMDSSAREATLGEWVHPGTQGVPAPSLAPSRPWHYIPGTPLSPL